MEEKIPLLTWLNLYIIILRNDPMKTHFKYKVKKKVPRETDQQYHRPFTVLLWKIVFFSYIFVLYLKINPPEVFLPEKLL